MRPPILHQVMLLDYLQRRPGPMPGGDTRREVSFVQTLHLQWSPGARPRYYCEADIRDLPNFNLQRSPGSKPGERGLVQ